MPLYEYNCECGKTTEAFRSVEQRHASPMCECGLLTRLGISIPTLSNVTFNEHYDVQLGQYFYSKEQKKQYLKENHMEQVSGSLSPSSGDEARPRCNREEATRVHNEGISWMR